MATGPIETHLHRSFNWENGAPGAREGPRGRSASCGNGLSAQSVRLRSEINRTRRCVVLCLVLRSQLYSGPRFYKAGGSQMARIILLLLLLTFLVILSK